MDGSQKVRWMMEVNERCQSVVTGGYRRERDSFFPAKSQAGSTCKML